MRIPVAFLAGLATVACAFGQESPEAAKAEYAALTESYTAAREAYFAEMRRITSTPEYKEAVSNRDRAAMQKLRSAVQPLDMKLWVAKFKKAAATHGEASGAAPFHAWIVLYSRDKDAANASLQQILEHHRDSADLEELAQNVGLVRRVLGDQEVYEKTLAMLLESSHKMVRAYALYAKGYPLTQGNRRSKPSEEDLAKGYAMLDECAQLAEGTTLALRARAPRFEKERLQIGMPVSGHRGRGSRWREVQAQRLQGQGHRPRFLGRLVRPLPGDVPTRAVARRTFERQAFRPDRGQLRRRPRKAEATPRRGEHHVAFLLEWTRRNPWTDLREVERARLAHDLHHRFQGHHPCEEQAR